LVEIDRMSLFIFEKGSEVDKWRIISQ